MKKYQEYMDGVTASDTLHEKLKNLDAPKKKPQPWKKYGVAAAALALVVVVGAAGIGSGVGPELGQEEPQVPDIAIGETEPNVAPNPMPNSPGMEMMGGYELRQGEGPDSAVEYVCLPYIQYGVVDEPMQADIALPVGVTRRDLTSEEIEALFGGEHNLTAHLNWSDYTLYAHAMVWPDDSLWVLCISGIKGDSGYEHFTLEVAPNMLPPTCLVYEESVANNIWEREVVADRYDGEHASTLRVSFMDEGYGYRFEITGANTEAIGELVSRAVRWIIVGDGLLLNQNLDIPADVPAIGPDGDQATTMPYDPSASPTPTVEPLEHE